MKSPPPLTYLSSGSQPNALWSWRARPTYFGFPECDNEGECQNTRVLQYEWESDEWTELAPLQLVRGSGHMVVEVPASFCTDLEASQRRKK